MRLAGRKRNEEHVEGGKFETGDQKLLALGLVSEFIRH